jgi:hypothetical protein
VAESVGAVPQDWAIILVGHSGAGPLLPAIRETIHRKVAGYICFDAGLPRDGGHFYMLNELERAAALLQELASGTLSRRVTAGGRLRQEQPAPWAPSEAAPSGPEPQASPPGPVRNCYLRSRTVHPG